MLIKNRSTGLIPYPTGPLASLLRLPMLLYRIGLGPLLNWIPFLILTTEGRKSGQPRHVVLEFRQHGSKRYVVSGWGPRPQWVQNLSVQPNVTLQHGRRVIKARAVRVEDPAEALRALYMFRKNSFLYELILASMSTANTIDFRTLTEVSDEFTVIRLEEQPGTPLLPSVQVDYPALGPVILLGAAMLLIFNLLRSHAGPRS